MSKRTLFIALGGTGQNVLSHLRRRLEYRFGTENPDHVRFLYVDTDSTNEAFAKFPQRSNRLVVGASKMRDCQQKDSDTAKRLRLDEWFDPDQRKRLTTQSFEGGVSGERMFGRLAFLASDNLGTLRSQVNADLRALRSGDDPQAGSLLHIIVVASAGGGTGSGCFLDMGYLTRLTVKELNIRPGTCVREGVVALAVPALVPAPQQARNSAALLCELDWFSEAQNAFKAVYAGGELDAALGREAPYDYTWLASPTQGDQNLANDPGTAIGRLEEKIADFLYLRLTGPDEIYSRMVDMRSNWVKVSRDRQGYPTAFLTFGVSLRQFPVGKAEREGYGKAARNFAAVWLKEAAPGERYLADSEAEKSRLRALYEQDLATLREMLGLPGGAEQDQDPRPPRDCDKDAVYQALTVTGPDLPSLESALRSRAAQGSASELFQYAGGDQVVTPSQPGYVKGTVRRNVKRLLDREKPESLANRTQEYFWNAAFDQQRGPRYALRLLREIRKALGLEDRFLDQVAASAGQGSAGGERTPAPGKEHARQDWLLWGWNKKVSAAEKGFVAADAGASAGANRQFEHCLVEAKRDIYRDLEDRLFGGGDLLQQRLERLTDYVIEWRKSALAEQGSSQSLAIAAAQNRTLVYPGAVIEERFSRIIPTVKPESLGALRAVAREETFGTDMPRSSDGRIDFAPFHPLEEQIGSALRSKEGGPSETLHGDSVVRLLSEAKQGQIQEEARTVVAESRPLLNLHLDAVGYGELLDTDPPAFPAATVSWYLVANSSIHQDSYLKFTGAAQQAAGQLAPGIGVKPEAPMLLIPDAQARLADPSTLAAFFIRCAFPTRIINGYDTAERERLLHPPDAPNIYTHFSQTGIGRVRPPHQLERAERMLLLGEALLATLPAGAYPRIILEGVNHVVEYQRDNNRVDRVPFSSLDFETAAFELATAHPDAVKALENRLRKMADDAMQRGRMADTIAQHIKSLHDMGKAQPGRYKPLDLGNVPYARAVTLLLEAADEMGISLDPRDNPLLLEWARLDEERNVWVCRDSSCEKVLGTEAPRWNAVCPNPECPNHRR
jgi:hypothetical protein